ncbi:MAG: hypothetical protein WCA81_16575 [Rhizomicrobium sp.]
MENIFNDGIISAVALGAAALGCCFVLVFIDYKTARFAADPSPDRVVLVKALGAVSLLAVLGIYGSFIAATVIIIGNFLLVPPILAIFSPRALFAVGIITSFWVAARARRWLGTLGHRIANRRESESQTAQPALDKDMGAALPWFAAMQYYALILNRTYKVFIADTMLCGAKVLGLVASPPADSAVSHQQDYWVSTLSATLYEHLNVTSAIFLRLSFSNFQIRWHDISRIDFNPKRKWGMGNVPHSGRIILRLRSGRSRELILLGDQDGEALKRTIEDSMKASGA